MARFLALLPLVINQLLALALAVRLNEEDNLQAGADQEPTAGRTDQPTEQTTEQTIELEPARNRNWRKGNRRHSRT